MEIRSTLFVERLKATETSYQSPLRRAFSILEQPFFCSRHRFRRTKNNDDIAFFQPCFRCRFDGADASAADGADFAAELLKVELIEGAPDGAGARAEQH